jgi:hypothetical protein
VRLRGASRLASPDNVTPYKSSSGLFENEDEDEDEHENEDD